MDKDEFFARPDKFGAPGFEEFKRSTAKYLGKGTEEIFDWVDNGSHMLNPYIKKYKFEILGHRTDKLEKLYNIIRDYGIPFSQLEFQPELIPLGGGKCDVLVKFLPRLERERRR